MRRRRAIRCPACGRVASSRAPACPSCGEPIRSSVERASGGAFSLRDPVHVIGLVLAILLLLLAFVPMMLSALERY